LRQEPLEFFGGIPQVLPYQKVRDDAEPVVNVLVCVAHHEEVHHCSAHFMFPDDVSDE